MVMRARIPGVPHALSYGMQIIRGSGDVVDLERQRLMSTRLELTARACGASFFSISVWGFAAGHG
jgi:hypothetical protein